MEHSLRSTLFSAYRRPIPPAPASATPHGKRISSRRSLSLTDSAVSSVSSSMDHMDNITHFVIMESLAGSIDSASAFRSVIRVMLGDKKLSWGRIVIICEVAIGLVKRFPNQKDDIMQVMVDACNITSGTWNTL